MRKILIIIMMSFFVGFCVFFVLSMTDIKHASKRELDETIKRHVSEWHNAGQTISAFDFDSLTCEPIVCPDDVECGNAQICYQSRAKMDKEK